jgi:hypothetical protein
MMITHDISDLAQQATSAPPAIIDADQFGLEDMASRAFRLSVTCGLMSAWDDSDLGLRLSYVGSSLNSGPAATCIGMSVSCRFCCRNRHADGAGRLVPFLKPSVATRWVVRAAYARLY